MNSEKQCSVIKREELDKLLNQTVTVVIDRPVGYVHGDVVYPVNYGYLPGVLAGDGEEQDAYVLGPQGPLEQFTGCVIAVVRRADDEEDKLVVAPQGVRYTAQQIQQAVYFAEQYFDSRVQTMWEDGNER